MNNRKGGKKTRQPTDFSPRVCESHFQYQLKIFPQSKKMERFVTRILFMLLVIFQVFIFLRIQDKWIFDILFIFLSFSVEFLEDETKFKKTKFKKFD